MPPSPMRRSIVYRPSVDRGASDISAENTTRAVGAPRQGVRRSLRAPGARPESGAASLARAAPARASIDARRARVALEFAKPAAAAVHALRPRLADEDAPRAAAAR